MVEWHPSLGLDTNCVPPMNCGFRPREMASAPTNREAYRVLSYSLNAGEAATVGATLMVASTDDPIQDI